MKVKTYRAATTRMALQQIKHELGSDAFILGKKEIRRGRLVGMFRKGYVEVTAAVDFSGLPPKTESAAQSAAKIADRVELRPETPDRARHSENQLLLDEVRKLKSIIQSGSSRMPGSPVWPNPRRFASSVCEQMHADLVGCGIEDSLALDLVAIPSQSHSELRKKVASALKSRIRIHPELVVPTPGLKPSVVAMLGPTGVGKTTTLAKIAARAALQEGLKVALVTLDTFRIAAVEQLKTYGEIMGLPLRVVESVKGLAAAIRSFEDKDLVLIDTAGRSQYELSSQSELGEFMSSADNIQKALVVSATTRQNDLQTIVDRYESYGTGCLIFTKLDETRVYGGLIHELVRTRKPLAYVTTGQRVPQDIRRPDAAEFIELALGGTAGLFSAVNNAVEADEAFAGIRTQTKLSRCSN
jgi:flagellar biosynthesis protein FlhF